MSWYAVIAEKLNIKEPFEMPAKLMQCMQDEAGRVDLFHAVLAVNDDLSRDVLSQDFQDNIGNRKELMQDFTPDSICQIIMKLAGNGNEHIADICAGTGGLTIRTLNENPDAHYYLEEISKAAVPVLLFNLAIRNARATVTHGDSLTGKTESVYTLTPGEKFSTIEVAESAEPQKVSQVITNPPYSLKWDQQRDDRFDGYELAPKSKADFAFILHGLHKLQDDGELLAILPHGVLFRGAAEGKIRQTLIENNLIDMIIGLPGKMFLNTDIPTVIMKLKKNRQTTDVLFIDASKEFRQEGRKNVMDPEHIEKLLVTARHRMTVEKYSSVVTADEMAKNDFNLNIPRFVDTSEPPEPIDIGEVLREMIECRIEIEKTERELLEMMRELVGNTPDKQTKVDQIVEAFETLTESHKQISFEDLVGSSDLLPKKNGKGVRLLDVADLERAAAGKAYPAGSTTVQISATRGQTHFLEEDTEVEPHYVVITPKVECDPFYLHQVIDKEMPSFCRRHQNGLNIVPSEFKHLWICWHDIDDQKRVAKALRMMLEAELHSERMITAFEKLKKDMLKDMLQDMFV